MPLKPSSFGKPGLHGLKPTVDLPNFCLEDSILNKLDPVLCFGLNLEDSDIDPVVPDQLDVCWTLRMRLERVRWG